MFVTRRTFRASQDEVKHLRRELDQARQSLERYASQERELLDALVSARTDARRLRTLAEGEAQELREKARAELERAEARATELLDDSRRSAEATERAAREQKTTLEAEIGRLQQKQQELVTSLQRGLAALGSLPDGVNRPIAPAVAGEHVRESSDQAIDSSWPAPSALASFLSELHESEGGTGAPPPGRSASLPAQSVPKAPARLPPHSFGWNDSASRRGKRIVTAALVVASTATLAFLLGAPRAWYRPTGSSAASATPATGARLPTGGKPGTALVTAASRAAGSAPLTQSVPLVVDLRGARAVWVRAEVDGRTVVSRLVRADERFESSRRAGRRSPGGRCGRSARTRQRRDVGGAWPEWGGGHEEIRNAARGRCARSTHGG